MFVDSHTHMISRTTDDYEAMAAAGIVALIEPAFWLGQPRTFVGSYIDYLSTLIGFERFRAGQFGIRHYCTVGLNSKEANNEELAEAVRAGPFAMPSFGPSAVTDDELDSLATFLEEELKEPEDPGGWSIGHVGPVAEGAVALAGGLGALAVVARLLGTGRDDQGAPDGEDGERDG